MICDKKDSGTPCLCNDKRGLNAADLTDEEIRLLRGFRALDPKSQGRILERLEMLQT